MHTSTDRISRADRALLLQMQTTHKSAERLAEAIGYRLSKAQLAATANNSIMLRGFADAMLSDDMNRLRAALDSDLCAVRLHVQTARGGDADE